MSEVKRDTHLRPSLRAAINAKCYSCIYDPLARGNWRQQVTVCYCYSCPLWEVRPRSRAPIPKSVLKYYGVEPDDPCLTDRKDLPDSRTACGSDEDRVESNSVSQGPVRAPQPSANTYLREGQT